jgi:YD repeat-containing protein
MVAGLDGQPQVTLYTGNSSAPNRVTNYTYDWQDELQATNNGITLTYNALDNLGETTSTQIYNASGASVTQSPDGSTIYVHNSGGLEAETDYSIDGRGQVYQSIQDGVLNGYNTGNQLITNYYHDGRGDVIETDSPSGLVTGDVYDGAGRLILTSTGGGTGNGGGPQDPVSYTQTYYDGNGNAVLVATTQEVIDATDDTTNPADIPSRTTYVATDYDAANRPIWTSNLGTNNPIPVGSTTYTPSVNPPDDGLTTTFQYDSGGVLNLTTDPRGVETFTVNNALGLPTTTIAGYTDGTPTPTSNLTTGYGYNALNQITSTTYDVSVNVSNGTTTQTTQTTTYNLLSWHRFRS